MTNTNHEASVLEHYQHLKELERERRLVQAKANRRRWAREGQWRRAGAKGATVEVFDELLRAQNGVCAICEGGPGKNGFNLDFDRRNGKPRGVICNQCRYYLRSWENMNQLGLTAAIEGYILGRG